MALVTQLRGTDVDWTGIIEFSSLSGQIALLFAKNQITGVQPLKYTGNL
jgi:hypothetical protein